MTDTHAPAPNAAQPVIRVVGLGPGSLDQLSLGAVKALRAASVVLLRTARHPTVAALATPDGQELVGTPIFQSFDAIYETSATFADVYEGIVSRLIALARAASPVTYAVPGHPLVAEKTVALLLQQAESQQVHVEIIGSASSVEVVCEAIGADAAAGLQVVDALDLDDDLSQPAFPAPWAPILVLQLYSRSTASSVKLALLQHYAPTHVVQLVKHAGIAGEQQVVDIPLAELDRAEFSDHLSSLWVPPVDALHPRSSLRTLEHIVARLRAPDGCPWDREQTHHSIKRNLLEETYELLEALDADDAEAQTEELGDVLFQVFLHAQMGRDDGAYDLSDITTALTEKLVRRHPHVFGDVTVADSEEVLRNWEAIKKTEGKGKKSVLEGLPVALPALTMALALARRAATSGFAWRDVAGAERKFEEELAEFRAAQTDEERRWEFGDVLFALAAWGRMDGLDPEECLRAANVRFKTRFAAMEALATERGRPLSAHPLEELLALWDSMHSPSP